MRDAHTIPLGACVCIYSSATVIYAQAFYINDQDFEYRDKWGPIVIVLGLFVTLGLGIIREASLALSLIFVIDGHLDWEL